MEMKTREEHLAWCKQRAMEYAMRGDLDSAVASMGSDLNKHPETKENSPTLVILGMMLVMNHDADGVRRWIEGFR